MTTKGTGFGANLRAAGDLKEGTVQAKSRQQRAEAAKALNATPGNGGTPQVGGALDAEELPELISSAAAPKAARASKPKGLAAQGLKEMKLTWADEDLTEIKIAALHAGMSAREFVMKSALASARKHSIGR